MAEYGPNDGVVPFTGFTPTLGTDRANMPSADGGNVSFNGMTQQDRAIAHALFGNYNRVTRRLMATLLGATAGSTATETRTQIVALNPNDKHDAYSGLVEIETVDLINRATTAADITNLNAILNRSPVPTYADDVGGNGGGGKAGW